MLAKSALLSRLEALDLFPESGRIERISGGELSASGPDAPLAANCEIVSAQDGSVLLRAQVVDASVSGLRLMPFGKLDRVRVGDIVRLSAHASSGRAGDDLAGRAINALCEPIDGGPVPVASTFRPDASAILDRISPAEPLATGVAAIDGLLTFGMGQRIGIFAASGVGKTTLVEQILRQAGCERLIVCLIGERGREVESVWSQVHAMDSQAHTSLVAATSDESAAMRVQALEQALCMAEYWRAAGENVLLLVDSVTRYAMALREIGLAAGEPPMVRAYTPNVLRELPRIVERCGAVRDGGSISAIFTVLSETDDVDDPIVEVMKALLDGHIVLSRRLAEAGHFPAIDIGKSISRLFERLAGPDHAAAARSIRALLARYEESRILIESGMYKPGSDKSLDQAIAARAPIHAFLRQPHTTSQPWAETVNGLIQLAGGSA